MITRWSPAIFWAAFSALLLLLTTAHKENFILLAPPAVIAAIAAVGLYRQRARHFETLGIARSFGAKVAADASMVLGAGLTPKGSGTVGAIAALPLTYLFAQVELWARIPALALLTLLSVYATHRYLRYEKRVLDPKEVVVDELVGVSIAIAFVPWTLVQVAGAFVLFRVFDITKPGPIGWLEHRLPGAWGVMMDDVAAGLTAGLIMLVLDYAKLLP